MLTQDYKRICLWGIPRSGSTFVFYNLIEHAMQDSWNANFNTTFNEFKKGSEPFRGDIEKKLQEFEQEEYWFAKLLSTDLLNLKNANLLDRFLQLPDYNILILRNDIFQSVISLCIATIKNQWTNDQDNKVISIPVDLFKSMLAEQQSYIKLFDDMKFDSILYTEDLTQDFSDTWKYLTGEKLESNLENKIFKSPDKSKVVKNYKELYEIYTKTMNDSYCVLAEHGVHVDIMGNVKMCCDQNNIDLTVHDTTIEQSYCSTRFDKIRYDLRNGIRNKACDTCWNLEDKRLSSSRTRMNAGNPNLGSYDGAIRFWDIRDNNLCNMSCRICGSQSSSLWNHEAHVHKDKFKTEYFMYAQGNNPVIGWSADTESLFNKQLDNCHSVYFAGGEPLINDTHWKILQTLYDNKKWNVHVRYNTNLMKTQYKGNDALEIWKSFPKLSVSASIDAVGKLAEYSRTGTTWDTLESNILKLLKYHKLQVNITTSILTIHKLDETIKYLQSLGINQVYYFNVLTSPNFMSVNLLPTDHKKELWDKLNLKTLDIDPNLGYNQLKEALFEEPSNKQELLDYFKKFNQSLDTVRNTSLQEANRELWNVLNETS